MATLLDLGRAAGGASGLLLSEVWSCLLSLLTGVWLPNHLLEQQEPACFHSNVPGLYAQGSFQGQCLAIFPVTFILRMSKSEEKTVCSVGLCTLKMVYNCLKFLKLYTHTHTAEGACVPQHACRGQDLVLSFYHMVPRHQILVIRFGVRDFSLPLLAESLTPHEKHFCFDKSIKNSQDGCQGHICVGYCDIGAIKVCFPRPPSVWSFEHTSRSKASSTTNVRTVFGGLLSGAVVKLVRLAAAGRSCLYYKEPSKQPNESIKADCRMCPALPGTMPRTSVPAPRPGPSLKFTTSCFFTCFLQF